MHAQITAAGRARLAAAMKARWAARKTNKRTQRMDEKEKAAAMPNGIAASESVMKYGSLLAGYVKPADKCPSDPKGRTWSALLGSHAPKTLVARDPYRGSAVLVFSRKAAEKGLKDAGHEFGTQADQVAQKKAAAERAAEKQKAEVARKLAIQRERIGKVVAAAELREPTTEVWRFIAEKVVNQDFDGKVLERRGISYGDGGYAEVKKATQKLTKGADGRTLRGLVIELFLWSYGSADLEALGQAEKIFKIKFRTPGKSKGSAK